MTNSDRPVLATIKEQPTTPHSNFVSLFCLLRRCLFNLTVIIVIHVLLVAYVIATFQHIWYNPSSSFCHILVTDLLDARVIGLGLIFMFLNLSQYD